MEPFLLFAVIAAAMHAIHSIANKYLVARSGIGALAATFLVQGVTGVIALPIILLTSVAWVPGSTGNILAVVFVSLLGFILMMFAFALDDASSVGPILGMKVIFVAFLESLTLGKSIAPGIWGAAVLSLSGVVFISQTDRWSLHPKDLLRPGVITMGFSALCFAVCDVYLRRAVTDWGNSWAVTLYICALLGLCSAIGLAVMSRFRLSLARWGLGFGVNPRSLRLGLWPMLASAVGIFLTQYFFFTSFAIGQQITVTNIIYNVRSLFVIGLMAFLVLGRGSTIERAGWRAYVYRASGVLLTLAAIWLAMAGK